MQFLPGVALSGGWKVEVKAERGQKPHPNLALTYELMALICANEAHKARQKACSG